MCASMFTDDLEGGNHYLTIASVHAKAIVGASDESIATRHARRLEGDGFEARGLSCSDLGMSAFCVCVHV